MKRSLFASCVGLITNASRYPQEQGLAPPDDMRKRLKKALQQFVSLGRRQGIPDDDLAEAQFALVAYLDQQLGEAYKKQGRNDWLGKTLQFEFYGKNTAGDEFFERLAALVKSGKRPFALEVFYLCLEMGFGNVPVRQKGDLSKRARERLRNQLPSAEILSPHGRPRGESVRIRLAWGHLPAVVGGGIIASLVLVIALAWVTKSRLNTVFAEAGVDSSQEWQGTTP